MADRGSPCGLPAIHGRASLREAAVVAISLALLAWYRLRFALPAPLGRHSLLHRRMREWSASPGEDAAASGTGDRRSAVRGRRLERLFLRALEQAPAAGGSCVPRSLALARLLRLHGLAAELRVGMRRAGSGFAGHAWVVHHGAVIAQGNEFVMSFAALALAPAAGRVRIGRAV